MFGYRIKLADALDINNDLSDPYLNGAIRSQEGRPLALYFDEPGVYRMSYKICMVDFEGDRIGGLGGDGTSNIPENVIRRGVDLQYELNDSVLLTESDLSQNPPVRGKMVGTSLGSCMVFERNGISRPQANNTSRFPTYLGQSSRGLIPLVEAKNIPNEVIEKGQIFKFDAYIRIDDIDLIDQGDSALSAKLNIKIKQAFVNNTGDPFLMYIRYFFCAINRVSAIPT